MSSTLSPFSRAFDHSSITTQNEDNKDIDRQKNQLLSVAESDAPGTIAPVKSGVGADVRGRSGSTNYGYHMETSADERLSMAEKVCLSGTPTPERTTFVRVRSKR